MPSSAIPTIYHLSRLRRYETGPVDYLKYQLEDVPISWRLDRENYGFYRLSYAELLNRIKEQQFGRLRYRSLLSRRR